MSDKRERVINVLNKHGKRLSPCSEVVAWVLLNRKRAIRVNEDTIKIIIDKKDLKKIRKAVIKRDNRICFFCGRCISEHEVATVDHLDPRHINKEGECGYDDPSNLVCSCLECNQRKGSMTAEEYILNMYFYLIGQFCLKYNIDLKGVFHDSECKLEFCTSSRTHDIQRKGWSDQAKRSS